MKKTKIQRLLSLAVAATLAVTSLTACTPGPATSSTASASTTVTPAALKEVHLTYLMDWVGSSTKGMADAANNPVALKIKEKTGVTIDIEYEASNEAEKLNLMFASQTMPDIVNAPYWGASDPATVAIKKAATQGLLLDLDPLINKFGPNLKSAFTTGLAIGYLETEVNDPTFGGKHYVLPQQAPASNDDVKNWGGGLYCRKDILDSLKIDPKSINTSEALYNLLVKIKAGGFKDINGKDVIPAGAWGDGWDYVEFWRPFRQDRRDEMDLVNGKYVYRMNNPMVDQRVLYFRKLISEGLFDAESLRQSDTQGKEKMATGRVAIVGNHYFHIRDFMDSTLYKTNPEMHYLAIGPLPWSTGQTTTIEMPDRNGTPVMFLPKTCKDPEAAIRFLDYLNSNEGQLLAYYGIEGTHYTMVNGKPRATAEWLAKWKADPKSLRNLGIRTTFMDMICLDKRLSSYGELELGDAANVDTWYDQAKSVRTNEFKSGYTISVIINKYPQMDKIKSLLDWNLYRDTTESAYFAKSDAAALKILNDFRKQLTDAGVGDFEAWVTAEMAKHPDYIA